MTPVETPFPATTQRMVAPAIPSVAAALSWESEDVLFKQECELLKLEDVKDDEEATAAGEAKVGKGSQWVLRGLGLLRVLRHQDNGRARVVVQQAGSLHALLNARLLPAKFQAEGKRVVRFLASERVVSAENGSAWEKPAYFRAKLSSTPLQERLAAVLQELHEAANAIKRSAGEPQETRESFKSA